MLPQGVCLNYCYHVYQNLLNITYAFKCYHQNVSWPHFSWPTLYVRVLYKCNILSGIREFSTFQEKMEI